MAGVIICGFLKVPFKVLYAFYVLKTEPLIIVYRVMVMHDGCLCGKQLQDIVFNEAAEVLLFMGCIIRDLLIPIEPHAGLLFVDHDHGIIPEQHSPLDHGLFEPGLEILQSLCGPSAELADISFARMQAFSRHA